MPRVSAFYGIVIYLYYRDHAPPHFHALYGEHEAEHRIETGEVIRGGLPPRAAALVKEWAARYKRHLLEDWERARRHRPLRPIPPLD